MPTSGVDRLVLDTSAYSHFRGGHAQVLDALARAERVLIPVTVLGELEAAFEWGSRARENRRALEDFLEEPFVDLLPVTAAVARQYGRVFAGLRRAGTPIPVNDIWIAAVVIDCGGTLLTFDRDFDRVAGLDHVTLSAAR
ncbi:MAG: type II toxin-antitoxin system VapC family toxin [Acidobacteriota bacterium]|nr:type II toxin-antitoxin system VapC family toxin [Acidobacteriota bacterium]